MQSIKKYGPVLIMLLAGCGDIPSDAIPIILNEEPITGITLTSDFGIDFGTFGTPTKGGDADGKTITCEPGEVASEEPHNIPRMFRLHSPFPNPAAHTFHVMFSTPCRLEAQIWAVVPSGQGVFGTSEISQGVVVNHNQRVLWRTTETFNPGVHAITVSNEDDPGGFLRVYFKADGILAWRDVGFFNDPCLIPPDLDGLNGLFRSLCGR